MPSHVQIEHSTKPWFGPKKRAKELLTKRTIVLPPEQAIEILLKILGRMASAVQRARFIDFQHKDQKGFRYTIVIVWTRSDDNARQAIYEMAEELIQRTGCALLCFFRRSDEGGTIVRSDT